MNRKKSRGFTLLELVMVMVIIAVIAMVTIPKFSNLTEIRSMSAAKKLMADLRFAHLLAMQSEKSTRVVFDAANESYALQREVSVNNWTAIKDPQTMDDFIINLNSGIYEGVVISQAAIDGGSTIRFDGSGDPYNAAGDPLAEPAYVDLNAKYRVSIRAQTGKVELSIL